MRFYWFWVRLGSDEILENYSSPITKDGWVFQKWGCVMTRKLKFRKKLWMSFPEIFFSNKGWKSILDWLWFQNWQTMSLLPRQQSNWLESNRYLCRRYRGSILSWRFKHLVVRGILQRCTIPGILQNWQRKRGHQENQIWNLYSRWNQTRWRDLQRTFCQMPWL